MNDIKPRDIVRHTALTHLTYGEVKEVYPEANLAKVKWKRNPVDKYHSLNLLEKMEGENG
jgi:hypothetical protein